MKKFKNKKILLSLLIIFIIGLAVGLFFITFISDIDKDILNKAIKEYITLVNANDYNYWGALIDSLKINLIYITVIWASSMLIIFSPFIYFIIFYKGFLLGFLISSFIFVFKLKGIVFSLVFMFPHEFFNIAITVSLAIISIKFTRDLILKIKSDESFNTRVLYKKYFITYFVYVGLCVLSSLFEVFVNSFLIKLVI